MRTTYIVKISLFGKESVRKFTSKDELKIWINVLIDNEIAFEVDTVN